MAASANDRHSFIVRIWREGGEMEWKGWVQHAGSGASITVVEMSDLLTFIESFKNEEEEGGPRPSTHGGTSSRPSGLK
jgi:hypothetical protein